jgi:hypothetical protein
MKHKNFWSEMLHSAFPVAKKELFGAEHFFEANFV